MPGEPEPHIIVLDNLSDLMPEIFTRILPMNLRQFVVSRAHDTISEIAITIQIYQELCMDDSVSNVFKYVSGEDSGCILCPSLQWKYRHPVIYVSQIQTADHAH